jgi:hypothetical protein
LLAPSPVQHSYWPTRPASRFFTDVPTKQLPLPTPTLPRTYLRQVRPHPNEHQPELARCNPHARPHLLHLASDLQLQLPTIGSISTCLRQATHPRLPPANALPHPPNQFFAPTIAPNSSQFHCQACSRASCTCTTQDKRFNGSPSFATEDDNSLLRTDLQYSLPQTSCSRT